MKKWRYPLVSFFYVLPAFLWDSFFERISSPGLTYFWAFLVVAGAINVFFQGKMNIVKSGAIGSVIAGMLIGVVIGAVNWAPADFTLFTHLLYLLAPLMMLYLPVENMLKNGQKTNGPSRVKNEEEQIMN